MGRVLRQAQQDGGSKDNIANVRKEGTKMKEQKVIDNLNRQGALYGAQTAFGTTDLKLQQKMAGA
ncbi:hypothetical protein FACS189459_6390 [Bacilli bacterium]|nr:hypothetical protein FACS189459_6390 [Bacilli bacterium]GHU52208.1 hypothetical protein FACS189496_1970 [Bacilli bacterium]